MLSSCKSKDERRMKRTTHPVLTLSVSFTLLLIGILPWLPENNAFSTPESALAARQTSLTASPSWSPSEESSNALPSVDAATTTVLQQVLETMQQVMTSDFFQSADSLASFYSQISKSVEIRPSSIPNAGLGLFCSKEYKAKHHHQLVSSPCLGNGRNVCDE